MLMQCDLDLRSIPLLAVFSIPPHEYQADGAYQADGECMVGWWVESCFRSFLYVGIYVYVCVYVCIYVYVDGMCMYMYVKYICACMCVHMYI